MKIKIAFFSFLMVFVLASCNSTNKKESVEPDADVEAFINDAINDSVIDELSAEQTAIESSTIELDSLLTEIE